MNDFPVRRNAPANSTTEGASTTAASALASELLGGRFIRRLGGGSTGEVYLVEEAGSSQQVAVKVLDPTFTDDPLAIERFHREASLVQAIQHPNVVRVYRTCHGGGRHW